MEAPVFKMFVYATDQGQFYSRIPKRALSEKTLRAKIIELAPEHAAPDKMQSLLTSMRMLGQPYSVLFPHKVKPNLPESLKNIYEATKESIPIKVRKVRSGLQLFLVDEEGQYKFEAMATPDSLLGLSISSGTLSSVLKNAYESDTISASFVRTKLSYADFVRKMLDQIFADEDKALNEEPALVAWDDSKPAYKILKPEVIQSGETPTWDQFLARMDFPEVYMSWVWSIFDPENDGRQCLWVHGPRGHDGKSSAASAILNFLGRENSAMFGNDDYKGDFFYGRCYGKRFLLGNEIENPFLIREPRIKSILGRDTVEINDKYQKTFSAELNARIMVLSNTYPTINYSSPAEKSRLLVVRMVKSFESTVGDSSFRKNLTTEFPAFLAKCRELYPKYFPTRSNMERPPEMDEAMENKYSTIESELLEEFIATNLDFSDKDATMTRLELRQRHIEVFGAKEYGQNPSVYSYNRLVQTLEDMGVKLERPNSKNSGYRPRLLKGVKLVKHQLK